MEHKRSAYASAVGVALRPSLAPAASIGSGSSLSGPPFQQPLPPAMLRRASVAIASVRPRSNLIRDDRTLSKLTLDEELYDILYAFSDTDAFLPSGLSGTARTGDTEDEEGGSGKTMSRQVLLSKIREKKEVIGKLRCQPWNMQRKRRALRLAQKYLEQHESKVSKTHLYKEELLKRWHMFLRWFGNIKTYLIPWEAKIKRIESHFGSVVSSYFTFLRWIIFVNLIITFFIFCFVVIPEVVADAAADPDRKSRTFSRKRIPPEEIKHADELQVLWHYDGYLRYSPLFYGYYSNDEFVGRRVRYAVPLAYFLITLFIFAYSFWAILRKMAANARLSKMTAGKAEQYTFNWKVFTGWDYTIGNQETASNTVMAIIIKLREAIADCKIPGLHKLTLLTVTLRVIANIIICGMLAFSIYCITFAVQSSQTVEATGNLFAKNQVPSVVATITHVFPMIFDLIGRLEKYHPRKALRVHLLRVLILYVLNYATLIIALFEKLDNIRDITRTSDESIAHSGRFLRDAGSLANQSHHLFTRASLGPNFTDYEQFEHFLNRTEDKYQNEEKQRTSRQTTGQERTLWTTVWTTVHPEYGPVTFNTANAVLTNGSAVSPLSQPYETIRLGPSMLPTFPVASTAARPPETAFHGQQFGPQLLGSKDASDNEGHPTAEIDRKSGKVFPTRRNRTRIRTDKQVSLAKYVMTLIKLQPFPTPSTIRNDNKTHPSLIDKTNVNGTYEIGGHARITTDDSVRYNDHICWETMIGQEIVKLVTMDLIITIISILVIDFLRGLWIKYCSSWWCWDIESTFPEYGEFKVAENVLHIIYNQGLIWLGLFFAPLLPAINNVKLIVILYVRAWAVMTCNVPAREIFRDSRSSNFYLWILLFWLLGCTLPVGLVIASKRPSTNCGPFANSAQFYYVITHILEGKVDKKILGWMRYVASPGVVIPILILLVLIIYFLVSLVRGLREANSDLQQQLVHERTEEKKKIFELAGGGTKKATLPTTHRSKESRKKPLPYLPDVEKKRREPWRAFNERDNDSSICVSDEHESPTADSPSSNAGTPLLPLRPSPSLQVTPRIPGTHMDMLTPTGQPYQPSLSSLIEAEASNEGSDDFENRRLRPKKNVGHGWQATVGGDRIDDWYNDDSRSNRSCDVQPGVVPMVTPEEIRHFMRPFMEHEHQPRRNSRAISLLGFPKDDHVTVVFPTTGGFPGSRRSSKRSSYISLYDNNSTEESAANVMTGTGMQRPTRLMSPPRMRSHVTGSERALVHGLDPQLTTESEKEPESDERSSQLRAVIDAAATAAQIRRSPPTQAVQPKKFEPPRTLQTTFQPWPSIDEVEKTRKHRSTDSEQPIRRFRISVSPQRKLVPEPNTSGSDTDTSSSRRRFVIRHQHLPGAFETTSTYVTENQEDEENVENTPNSEELLAEHLSPMAPVIEFGEDDSPRVHEPSLKQFPQ